MFLQLKCRFPRSGGRCLLRGVSAWGGVCSQEGVCSEGVCSRGGVCSQGGVCSRGVSALGGSALGVSALGGVCSQGVSAPGGCLLQGCLLPQGGVPCDLSHHAFDVTCMLPAHQLRPTNSAAAYILLVM